MDKSNFTKRTAKEKAELISEWEQSNLSKKNFCDQKGINYQTFIGWTIRKRKPSQENEFIPLRVEEQASGAFAEIHLSGSRKIIFHQAVSADFIRVVLKC